MKIRTDFVTNSSSSSFVVKITVKTVAGKTYSANIGCGEYCDANISCSPESLLEYSTVEELMDKICDAVEVEDFEGSNPKKSVRSLKTKVTKDVQTLDQIASLTFERIWEARGEECSGGCAIANITNTSSTIYKLSEMLCEAQKNRDHEEVENLKKELVFHLNYYDGEIDDQRERFPSGFMGSSADCMLDLYGDKDDIIDFAHSVIDGKLEYDCEDLGIETTFIDMQKKTIRQAVVYGDCSHSNLEMSEDEYNELANFVQERENARASHLPPSSGFAKKLLSETPHTYIVNECNKNEDDDVDTKDEATEYPDDEDEQRVANERVYHSWKAYSEEEKAKHEKYKADYRAIIEQAPFFHGKIDYYQKYFAFYSDSLHSQERLTLLISGGDTESWLYPYHPYDYLCIDDQPDSNHTLRYSDIRALEGMIRHAKENQIRLLRKSDFVKALKEEKAAGYPYAKQLLQSWKSVIPFDRVPTISFEGTTFATTSKSEYWFYRYFDFTSFGTTSPTIACIKEKGGIVLNSITQACDYLIVGTRTNAKTAKVVQAIKLRDSGKSNIKIISEDDFIRIYKGEVLELSEEDQQIMRARQETREKAEAEKQQALLKKQQLAEEERQRKAEAKQAEREAKNLAAAELAEQQRQERLAEKERKAAEQAAEKAAKAAQFQQQEENRRKHMFDTVLFMPGEEPADIRKRIDSLCAKLDEAYPNKQISGLQTDHKKWAETVTALYRLLGYPDNRSFLEAYGYTVVQGENKGGRPTTVDPEAVIAELKRRYPNGGVKSTSQLQKDNSDLPIKTLINNAQKLFGMSLKDYLTQAGIISLIPAAPQVQDDSISSTQTAPRVQPETPDNDPLAFAVTELLRRYPSGGGKSIDALETANSDLSVRELAEKAPELIGMSLEEYLTMFGVLP